MIRTHRVCVLVVCVFLCVGVPVWAAETKGRQAGASARPIKGQKRAAARASKKRPKKRKIIIFSSETRVRVKPDLQAGSGERTQRELSTYVRNQTADLLASVPGLQTSQHGGRGKAQQFFVRGFDAVHGSELELRIQGIPINEVSNIHGQGYADLGFLIPIVIRRLRYLKGPFAGHQGDFAITGSIEFDLGLDQRGLLIEAGLGSFWKKQLQVAWGPRGQSHHTFVAAQFGHSEGFGQDRQWLEGRAMAQHQLRWGKYRLRFLVGAYISEFGAAGVLTEQDLNAGRVGFYDAQRPGLGGHSSRILGQVSLLWKDLNQSTEAMIYAIGRDLRLKENFTGYLQYAEGDTFEQLHQFAQLGARMLYKHNKTLWGRRQQVEAGLELRFDKISQAQYRLADNDERHTTEIEADVLGMQVASWLTARLRLSHWLRWQVSLRATLLSLQSHDRALLPPLMPIKGGVGLHLAPRTTLRFRLSSRWKLFAAYGLGFRSAQARSIGIGEGVPFQEAHNAEVGVQFQIPGWAKVSLAVFGIYTAKELFFDHASATNVYTGSGGRLGAEIDAKVRLWSRHLWLDTSVTYVEGRYLDGGAPIPLSPRFLMRNGLVFRWQSPNRFWRLMASLRTSLIGPRPLTFGMQTDTIFQLNLATRLQAGPVFVRVDFSNVLNQQWKDGQFMYSSAFRPSESIQQLPQMHFTAGAPLRLFVTLGVTLF